MHAGYTMRVNSGNVVVVSGMQLWDCVAPYVDMILHTGRFWAKSAASGSVRWCCFRSCWTVLSHVMQRRPGCLLQSAGGEANNVMILLASALSSMRIICPNRVSRRVWIIAVSLGCFVSLRTSSFRTNCQIGTIWCQAAYADTTGRVHLSYVRPSWISPSSSNRTGILVRCTCCTASILLRWRAVTSIMIF